MSFAEAIRTCFRKYATFSGRASRREYWWFFLFLFLGSLVCGVADTMLFGTGDIALSGEAAAAASGSGPISAVFSLGTLVPALAAAWRRMHDSGRSGLHVLYPLIVMIGIMTFMGFVGGFDAMASGDGLSAFGGLVGLVLILAIIVLVFSPIMVLWWLARPTQPAANQWGPPPADSPPGRDTP